MILAATVMTSGVGFAFAGLTLGSSLVFMFTLITGRLNCAVVLSTNTYAAGSTPPPTASIVCYNPEPIPHVVTGVQLLSRVDGSDTPGHATVMGNALPPYGPGAPVVVQPRSTATVGPFPITVGSAAAGVGGVSQPTQVPDYHLMIGAVVTADGRASPSLGPDGIFRMNTAAEAGLTVTYTVRPKPQTQGGQFIYSMPSNSAGWFF